MKKVLSLLAGLVVLLSMGNTVLAVVDAEVPSDVENVKVEAGDEKAILSWDVATDNVGVTGYKVYSGLSSVVKAGDDYDFPPIDVGDVVSAAVKDLENGTTYYFAVTAYDKAGNESGNYSYEVSTTPAEGLGEDMDTDAPTVAEAEAVSKSQVDVEFSEPVELPTNHPEQAFSIENEETLELLDVLDAVVLDDKDVDKGKEGMVVRLTTAEQVKDAAYVLTATIDVTDLAGNPVISGTSDTAGFTGSDGEPVDADEKGPEVSGAEYVDEKTILVNFSETVVLSLKTADNFEITVKGVADSDVKVTGVVLGNNTKLSLEDASAIVTLETAMVGGKTYVVTVVDVTDDAGNEISDSKDSAEFTVAGEGGGDDPVDGGDEPVDEGVLVEATAFKAKAVSADDVLSVALSWVLPEGDASVLQKLYMSADKGAVYSAEDSMEAEIAEYSVNSGVEAGNEYWFKLTQVDEEGNESEGVVAKITLAETGPGVVGLVLVSLGLGRFASRKKRK